MRPLDVFPARVTRDGQPLFDRARVYLERDGRVRIFVREGGQIVKQLDAVIASVEYSKARGKPHVLFGNGFTFSVVKAGDCGCGDPLKRFNVRNAQ